MLTAVSYARFSSDRQHESSIEAQHAAIDSYAQSRDITIVRRYVDRAKSGTNDNRPDFLQMLSDLKTLHVDYVLVHKTDRFARNRYNAAVASRIIAERGARLICVAQDFGDGPEAVIMESLMQGMAEYYSLNLSTEVIKGRKESIKKGHHPGGTYPFGYRPDGQGGYVIDELEAYYIRKLYQAVIDGRPSLRSIITEMESNGVKGRRGQYLKSGNVAAMLRLPIYAGIYKARAGGEEQTIENHHPAIVSKTIYEEAVKIMDSRKNVGRKAKRPYLCTGLVFCGSCGAPMYGHRQTKDGREYVTYVCHKACGGVRAIRAEELEQAACDYVAALLAPDLRQQLTDMLDTYIADQRRHARSHAAESKKEIAKLRTQIDTIMDNMSSGVLPPSVLERLGKQITELESQIELLERAMCAPPEIPSASIADYFADAAAVSPNDEDPAATAKMLRRFISKITVHSTALEFECTFDAWLKEHCPTLSSSTPRSSGGSNNTPSGQNNNPDGGSGIPSPSGSSSSSQSSLASRSSCQPFQLLGTAPSDFLQIPCSCWRQLSYTRCT